MENSDIKGEKKAGKRKERGEHSWRRLSSILLLSAGFCLTLCLAVLTVQTAAGWPKRVAGRGGGFWKEDAPGEVRPFSVLPGMGERQMLGAALGPAVRELKKGREGTEKNGSHDFRQLRRLNPDVVAWLTVPGTGIDYPVVQGKDNETYLKTGFEGDHRAGGAIFLDCDCSRYFDGPHSVIYGHHMRDGSMFASLLRFREREFFERHREILLYLPERTVRLRTVAAVCSDGSGERRRTEFDGAEHLNRYLREMTEGCSFRELPPEGAERLYSLITCSYEFENARTVVYAVEWPKKTGA